MQQSLQELASETGQCTSAVEQTAEVSGPLLHAGLADCAVIVYNEDGLCSHSPPPPHPRPCFPSPIP